MRSGFWKAYSENPKKMLKKLYSEVKRAKDRELIAVLIELCYNQAELASDREEALSFYLSSCIYAYFYLFDERFETKPSPYEPQFLFAVRFYNYSVAQVFKYLQEKKLLLSRNFTLSYLTGQIKFNKTKNKLPHPLKDFSDFKICYEYTPFGFHSRTRQSGLGAPLVAVGNANLEKERGKILDASRMVYPVSLFIRFDIEKNGQSTGTLEYYDPMLISSIKLGKYDVPLEVDISTYLGYMLRNPAQISPLKAMMDPGRMRKTEGLYMAAPYQKEKIPVVFVHGLMSLPRTWVQMINTLLKNPRIREKYQFWLYAYPTANPVFYSAANLRRTLLQAQKEFDPEGDDPAFSKMVLVAHSMGGLLSKIMIQNSSNEIIEEFFGVSSIDHLGVNDEQKKFIKEMVLFKRLPFIHRVIFISVPHRGSDATKWMISQVAASFINLPGDLVEKMQKVNEKILVKTHLKENTDPVYVSTGVDNLDPDNKGIHFIEQLPIDDRVPYHSIIGNNEKAGVPGGTDGVVPYKSAHLDGAASELIVRSGHGAHETPFAIKEVRRILLKNLKE